MPVKTTNISWTDQTWNMIHARNLVTGKRGWHCEHVTEACRNCYAERLNMKPGATGGTGLAYKPGHRKDIEVFLNEEALRKPLHWRAARNIFVCSMTDLGADFAPDEWLDKILAIAALCPQHNFQILTKRPARMRAYLSEPATQARICAAMWDISERRTDHMHGGWPLRNVWIGTSICDQVDADSFIPDLLHTPAAIRFLSCEPLLGPITLRRISTHGGWYDALAGWRDVRQSPAPEGAIDWVIAGGESGPAARPMHPIWARSLRDQCAEAGVPFHFKQWGEWAFEGQLDSNGRGLRFSADDSRQRLGARRAGRLLDGVEHNDLPRAA